MNTVGNVAAILAPDKAQMLDHLHLLFGRAMTGQIEITSIKVTQDGERVSPRVHFFDTDQLEEAAEYAASVNAEHMWNVYVGAATRRPETFPDKPASDDEFYKAWAIHADIDDGHDLPTVREKYRLLGITPPFVVITGRTPTTRAQLWWPLEEPISDRDVYRATLRAVAAHLGTDPSVTAAKQLMRLAGGVNWPKKAGRVLEKTEVFEPGQAQAAFSLEQIQRAFPPGDHARPHSDEPHEPVGILAGTLAQKDLRSALASMRSDDRDLWIRMGLALKTLGDIGRGLWIEWSQTSEKYDPVDAARTWVSLHPIQTSYQAVFAEAMRGGWDNPASDPAPEPQRTPQDVIAQVRAEQQQEHAPEPEAEDEPAPKPSGPFRASELTGEPPERQWIVPEWIVEGAVNSLYGDGGVGKTLLAQQLACSVSLGATWLGLPTKRGSVLAVLCEDEKDELWRRHNHIKAAMGYAVGNPFSDVWLWPRVGDDNVMVRWDRDGTAILGGLYADVVRQVEALEPSLLVLDTLADVYGGNEIDRPQVNYFVKTVLGGLIKARAAIGKPLTVLLLGHPSVAGKASGSGYSGSTAWNNAVRARLYLTKPEEGDGDERILTRGKANYAKSGDDTAVRLFFGEGVLHAQEDVEDGDSVLWAAKRDVVLLVDTKWRAGSPYNDRKGHARFIHMAVPAEMARGGFGPQITRQAIRELIDDGRIASAKSNGKSGYRSTEHAS